jgi:hypothetical protein
MENPGSERKPDDKEGRARPSGTIYDLLRVLLAGGTAVFGLSVIVLAIGGQYSFAVADTIPTLLFAYLLYHFGRTKRRPIGQEFNL